MKKTYSIKEDSKQNRKRCASLQSGFLLLGFRRQSAAPGGLQLNNIWRNVDCNEVSGEIKMNVDLQAYVYVQLSVGG